MDKSVQITLIVVVAVLIISGTWTYLFWQKNSERNTISVEGISTLKTEPDLITLYFRVETNSSTSQEAKDKNAEIMERVRSNLKEKGIDEKNITTENFNIYPEYDWIDGKQQFRCFKAVHAFKVSLTAAQVDKIGRAIDGAIDGGALIDYINFELSREKQNEYKKIVLRQASEDAKAKAEALAMGLNKKLGRIISVSDTSFDYYPWPIFRAMGGENSAIEAKEAITNIRPSEKEVTARISVTYQII